MTKFIINGKDTMTMSAIDKFKRHDSRPIYRVLSTTGRAKFRMATKRNKLKIATVGASIHGTAKGWVSTVNHLVNVIHNNGTRMK